MLRIELLGGFRASVGSRVIQEAEWRLRKARTLVKILALTPHHRLHREEVMERLWPDLLADAAVNNLHVALHSARRTLEPELAAGAPSSYLHTLDEALHLGPPERVQVDVESIENAAAAARQSRALSAYHAAVKLYAGDLLPEDRYEDWATARRDRLRDLFHDLLLEAAALHEAAGESLEAIALMRQVIARDAVHEQAHAGLMRLYALTGQRRPALRQYEHLRNALRSEVEAEPSPETQRLYRDIRDGRLPAAPQPQKEPTAAGSGVAVEGMRIRAGRRSQAPRPAQAAGRPAESVSQNLPVELTSFVGRAQQIARIKRLVRPDTLVTLTGTAGSGKTRLAVQAARTMLDRFPDGVWFADLAAIADSELVPRAVMGALGQREQAGRPVISTLVSHLGPLRALLILDNCEHLIEAAAGLVHALRAACPRLAVLVTSREALGVPGETIVVVPPLSLPALKRFPSLKSLERTDAVRLFLDRARLARPGYALSERNAAHVAKICHWLDGLPLAIELAAARLNVFSTEQMAGQLHDALHWLTGGRRTGPKRQQTLSGAIEWSYTLLSDPERKLFERLSVFTGGFTLDAAETVCGDAPLKGEEILNVLSRLVEKSLIAVIEEPDGLLRYRLPFVLRQYAESRLAEEDETHIMRSAHARFFLAMAETVEAHLTGPRQAAWLARLDQEHDNLQTALRWASDQGEIELGLRLAIALRWFWYVRGHIGTGQQWLVKLLETGGPVSPAVRAKALIGVAFISRGASDAQRALGEEALGLLRGLGDKRGMAESLGVLGLNAFLMGDIERANTLCREALALSREAGYQWGTAVGLLLLGRVAFFEGATTDARSHLEEALNLFRSAGDEWGNAYALLSLGMVSREQHDYGRAAIELQEGRALFTKVGDRREATYIEVFLALLAADQGDVAGALRVLRESEQRFRELEDELGVAWVQCDMAGVLIRARKNSPQAAVLAKESLKLFRKAGDRWGILRCLETLAQAAAVRGLHANASRLLGAVQSFRQKAGATPWPPARYDRYVDEFRKRLGDAAFSAAWAEGCAMTLDQAIEYGLEIEKD